MTKNKKPSYISGTGKRKSASARVRIYKGSGENLVNDIPVEKYFPGEINKTYWIKPFVLTDTLDKYYFTARIFGSGKNGQLDALVHGLARAFVKADPDKFKSAIKKADLLTRDSRIRQRRMVGMGGKSRRKKQSPKR